jgi:hypothetical protein
VYYNNFNWTTVVTELTFKTIEWSTRAHLCSHRLCDIVTIPFSNQLFVRANEYTLKNSLINLICSELFGAIFLLIYCYAVWFVRYDRNKDTSCRRIWEIFRTLRSACIPNYNNLAMRYFS